MYFSVVFHQGANVNGGHYTIATYDLGTNGWVLKDDGRVSAMSDHELFRYYEHEGNKYKRMPYFLVYHRVSHHANGPSLAQAAQR